MGTQNNYKRTLAGSVGAGVGAIFSAAGRTYYIIEHKTTTAYHNAGESEKVIVDQIELGRDSSCQIRFDESCETVSRKHAAIVRDGEGWKIIPLSQTNATYVNSVPVQGERLLNSGDEIKLSSNGPVMGFIVPQGAKSLVKSIGMTERMNLFRKQALAPYKKGLLTLTILFILAIGGFVGYSIITEKEHKKEMLTINQEIEKKGELIAEQERVIAEQKKEQIALTDKIAETEETIQSLNDEVEDTKDRMAAEQKEMEERIQSAAAAEKEALQAEMELKMEALKKESEAAKRKADEANKQLANYQQHFKDQEAAIKKNEAAVAQLVKEKAQMETEANMQETATSSSSASTKPSSEKTVSSKQHFSDIEECYSAVYYIKMDNIVVYDPSGRLLHQFDMSEFVGGTGFLLDDGRFVTARRVVEPWFYYYSSAIGKDSRGNIWHFGDLQYLANAGWKVEANFTAYSPAQTSFKFSSTEMTKKAQTVYSYIEYKPTRYVRRLADATVKLYIFDSKNSKDDWATLGKRDQLGTVEGLKYSSEASLSPKSGSDVIILGYPFADGYDNSLYVQPEKRTNTVNSPDLNNVGVIELATKRYYKGADGAPVMQQIDGVWTVIGILGHTDEASDRDFAAPIDNINM